MASPDRKSFLLRIDPRLWAELEAWAQQDLRSINGQIEFLLREAVARRRKSSAPAASPEAVPPPATGGDAAPPEAPTPS
jgi:hypothetical protein